MKKEGKIGEKEGGDGLDKSAGLHYCLFCEWRKAESEKGKWSCWSE